MKKTTIVPLVALAGLMLVNVSAQANEPVDRKSVV